MKINSQKTFAIALTAAALIGSTISATYAATAKAGGACTTSGASTTISGKKYVCATNIAKKLVWMVPAAASVGTNSKSAIGSAPAKPSIAGGGNDFHPSDEGSAADLARHAAMKKYSDCLVANGGTAFGPGFGRPGDGDHNGPGAQPSLSAAQKNAMTKCASLQPQFPGRGQFGGNRRGATPIPSATASTKA
jgi:hypothetical protein